MEYRVLGPVSAFLETKPRQLGGRRQRMVLAILLSRPNQVISQDWLIDAVWAGEPPDAARQTLHGYVSTLRKELDGGIERDGDGYIVRVSDAQLDAVRFEELVGLGLSHLNDSPVEAAGLIREGLALWHGQAYGDLNGEPALVNEVVRLEEARLAAVESRIDADLRSGNHLAVVQELEGLTREHPFREHLQGFLMLALYRSGRQADALRSYRRAERILAEELGIDPSPELRLLEEQILQQDPELDWVEKDPAGSGGYRAARGYELREEIDQNRYGVSYRGFQGSIGREVAVLALNQQFSSDPEFVRRFESELGAVSQLENPHLVPILDFWRDPEGAFLVTAHLRGGPLRDSISQGPLNLSSVLLLVDQISSALGFLHRNGFTHGRLDVDSVALDGDDNAYITDLGLASLASQDDPGRVSDVEGLASTAFWLLTGGGEPSNGRISDLRRDLAVFDPVFLRAFHPDSASRFEKVEDFRRALRQAAGADVVGPSQGLSEDQRRNPYKGLRAFQESDSHDFHGRDALIEDLIEILAKGRILAVVGPSGSGKSSLVRAGLLSALRSNAIEGSDSWLITEMFPGTHPFEELEAAILRIATQRPAGITETLTADRRGLIRVVKQLTQTKSEELVLVVDQFEELFSMTSSEADRKLFIESIVAAATDERSRIRVVLTLRADFFDQPLRYAGFGEVLGAGLVPVGPPTDDGLARAVAQPARDVGVDLEPGLVTRVVDDVRDEPGGLPLLQYTLTELFAQREHNTLTLAAYEESGGVLGALGKRAEEIYGGLTDDGKQAARQLFLRLVTVDEMADDTRRRVRQTELRGLSLNQGVLDDVIQQFGAFRLLSFDRDAATRTPTIEVAHEALIREWDRLRTWIDDRREDLLIHRRMQVTARDWEDSEKDPSYLLRGSRLEQALMWQERTDIAITDDEMTFIEASIEQEKRDLAEHQALEEKAAKRRKAVIGVLAGGVVVAGVFAAVAVDRAQSERDTTAEATARELSSAAVRIIQDDPELAILLSLEAFETTEEMGLEAVPEAQSALRDALRKHRVLRRLGEVFQSVAYSPDGERVATDDAEGAGLIHLWQGDTEVASWDTIGQPEIATAELRGLGFSVDGTELAVAWADPRHELALRRLEPAGDNPREMVALTIHDAFDLHLTGRLLGEPGLYARPSFAMSGMVAATMSDLNNRGKAYVWSETTDRVPRVFETEQDIIFAEFILGSNILVLAYSHSFDEDLGVPIPARVTAIDMVTTTPVWELTLPLDKDPANMSISPDGSMIAFGDYAEKRLSIWAVDEVAELQDIKLNDPQTLAWSHDGSRLAVAGNDGDVTVLESSLDWGVGLVLVGPESSIWDMEFHPDSQRVVTAVLEADAIEWDASMAGGVGDRAVWAGGEVGQFFLSPNGDQVTAGVLGIGARTIDLDTGVVVAELGIPSGFHFRPTDELTLVAGRLMNQDLNLNAGALVDAQTGEVVVEFPFCLTPKAVSPEGSLVVLDSIQAKCGPADDDAAGASIDGPSRLQDLRTGDLVIDLGAREIFKAMFSPATTFGGNRYLVVNAENQVIKIYDIGARGLLASFTAEEIGVEGFLTLGIDPQGRYLGIGISGSSAVVIDVVALYEGVPKMDSVLFNREVGKGSVPQVRVTSDGIMVSADFSGLYRVWDIETGQMLFEIHEANMPGQGAAQFTWDGKQLAYEDALGNIRFTPLDTYEVVEQAKAVLTRTLTDDECTQYLHTDGCEE